MKNKRLFLTIGTVLSAVALGIILTIATLFATGLFGNGSASNSEYEFVYSFPADDASECTSLEQFDQQLSECFFTCFSEDECADIEEQIDAELENLYGEYQEFSENINEYGTHEDLADEEPYLIYQIYPGEVLTVVSGAQNKGSDEEKVGKWLKDISPDDFSDQFINSLQLYKNSEDDTAAFVVQTEVDITKWDIYVNMSFFEEGDKEVLFTLIHEFGHILTLNNQQLDYDIAEIDCDTHLIDEGCTLNSSYLYNFHQKFWTVYVQSDSSDLYQQYPDHFVSEYAATNLVEDIAETFASYIFVTDPLDNSSVKRQKETFMHEYAELRDLRENIRGTLKPLVRERVVR